MFLGVKVAGAKALNGALSELYTSDLWLTRSQASRIAQRGLYFLRAFTTLARIFLEQGLARFPLYPKHHMCYHAFRGLLQSSRDHEFTLNIVADACPQDEDFVGRCARITRRCGTRQIVYNALRRYLIHCHTVWRYELY